MGDEERWLEARRCFFDNDGRSDLVAEEEKVLAEVGRVDTSIYAPMDDSRA